MTENWQPKAGRFVAVLYQRKLCKKPNPQKQDELVRKRQKFLFCLTLSARKYKCCRYVDAYGGMLTVYNLI